MTEQIVENLLREKIKDEIVLIIALKIKSTLYNGEPRKFHHAKNVKIASAIAYISFIKTNQVKSLKEISNMFEIEEKYVGRTYKKIKRILGMNFCKKEKMSMMGSSCIIQRMPKDFLGKIQMSEKSKKYTIQILKKIEKIQNFQGKKPQGVCASAVYISLLMNNERKPQAQIADLFGISEVCLRETYKEIIEELGLEEKLKINERENDRTKS